MGMLLPIHGVTLNDMNKNLRVNVSAIALVLAVGFMSGCAQDNTTTTTATQTPTTSATSTPTKVPNIGVSVTIRAESDGRVFWTVSDPAGGVAEGRVKVTVGDWVHDTNQMTGYIQPMVNPGNYTANVVYTDPTGGTLTNSTPYTLEKVTAVKMFPQTTRGPINKEWEATIEIKGSPMVTGTVTIYRANGEKFAEGTVGKDNIARIKMPVRDKILLERMVIKYSGDTFNPAAEGNASFNYSDQI